MFILNYCSIYYLTLRSERPGERRKEHGNKQGRRESDEESSEDADPVVLTDS